MRKWIAWFTIFCFVMTQTSAVAGPHEEGVAAGQAANPVARGSVTTPNATAVVPGYTTAPPESAYYRQPNMRPRAMRGSPCARRCPTIPCARRSAAHCRRRTRRGPQS